MRNLISFISLSVLLSACSPDESIRPLSTPGATAESVYLTRDPDGKPVAVWTERTDKQLTLLVAKSNDSGRSFTGKISIPLSEDVATHAESMPKVAFKADGTLVAAYEKKAPTSENKYAGAIYYRMSHDGGKSWTPEMFLHSDTVSGRSRSYFDIEQLADGEIGAAWLDVKLDAVTGGRSVRFAKTLPNAGFANEILVDSSACQCCRLDVYSDVAGQINVAYRGLMKGRMGQDVRDMMLATSRDNGASFSSPARISADNWNIDGCPHTGPSLCSNKSGLFSMWYTEGNGTGIYYSFKNNEDREFGKRELVSRDGRHPQLSIGGSGVVMVWEETLKSADKTSTQVCYQTSESSGVKKHHLSPADCNAYSPVVVQTANGFLIAFLMEKDNERGIYFASL